MLELLISTTTWLGLITGFGVLGLGDWRKFTLKYAGVALSTGAVAYLTWINFFYGNALVCTDTPEHPCMQVYIFLFMRNLAILVFHITSGRDTIRFKRCDRRYCPVGGSHGDRRGQA